MSSSLRSQRGVTIIEALVALVVMSLGMLAFAGLHVRLRVNSDVARERAEAVRLAQVDMENLRAYANLAAYTGITTDSTSEVVGTTTTFRINRTFVDSTDGLAKHLRVQYAWTDRTGETQTVVIRSSIAKIDPKLGAVMSIPPNGSPVKDPLGRDVQIPIPAKNLGDNTSVFKPNQGGGLTFVFNNDTGFVTRKCSSVTKETGQIGTADVTAGTNGCVNLAVPAYLISGYIRFSLSTNQNQISTSSPNDAPPNSGTATISVRLDDTAMGTSNPLGTLNRLNTSYWTSLGGSVGSSYTTPECGAQDSKTVQYTEAVSYSQTNTAANGSTSTTTQTSAKVVLIVPASTPLTAAGIQPYTTLTNSSADLAKISNVAEVSPAERYIGYACVVYPIDLDGAKAWSGRLTINPSPSTSWPLGTTNTTYKVCRYSADADLDGSVWLPDRDANNNVITPASSPSTPMTKIDNPEHPNAYIRVTQSLSNQNFLVIRGNLNCPTDGAFEVDGQGQDNYTDETTVLHQP